jgi:hypothetical protein
VKAAGISEISWSEIEENRENKSEAARLQDSGASY